MPTKDTHTIAAITAETTALIRRMSEMNIGDELSYAEMSEIVCGDICGKKYHCLSTARKNLLSNHQMVFETIAKTGIRRETDSEIVINSSGAIRTINRATRRAFKKLACADPKNLTNEEKLKHNTNAAMLGALRFMSQPQQVKALEGKCVESSRQIDISDTLKLFGQTK